VGLKEERDARLDALKEAFETSVETRLQRLRKQRNFLKNLLEGRGTTDRVQNDVLNKLGAVADTDLDKFLTG